MRVCDVSQIPVAAHLEPHRHLLCCRPVSMGRSQAAGGEDGRKARMSYAPLQLGRERTLDGCKIRSRCRGSAGRFLRVQRSLGRRLLHRGTTIDVGCDGAGRGRIDNRRHDESLAV